MAAGSTYSTIATTTLASAQTTVTFNSFSGYTDLFCSYSTLSTGVVADVQLQFNGDTATNYSVTILYGTGSATGSYRQTSANELLIDFQGSAGTTSGVFNTGLLNIMNYANTTTHKTILNRAGRAANGTDAVVGLWRSTSAITSMTFKLGGSGNQFAIGSTFTLYGIAAA